MAHLLKDLAKARHGLAAIPEPQDRAKLIAFMAQNPEITQLLQHLATQRDMLEAEVSRLGYKVTRLESALAASQDALRQLRGY